MHKIGKRALAFVAGAFLAGGLAVGTAGLASAAPAYSDTSVSVVSTILDHPVLNEATLTAPLTAPLISGSGSDTWTFGTNGVLAVTPGSDNGITASLTGDVLTITVPPATPAATTAAFTVTATRDGATATDVVQVTPAVGGWDVSPGTPDVLTVAVLPSLTNNNTVGQVDVSAAPAGIAYALDNAPSGVALSLSSIMGTIAIPGTYHGLALRATDAHGAAATETFSAVVKGFVVKPTVPHLSHGRVLDVSNNDATIAWNYVDYPAGAKECALTQTFGFGFSVAGSPHIGFTCFNASKPQDLPNGDVGYWAGLAAGHTYDIKLIPANADKTPIVGSPAGWITIVTTK